MSLDGPNNAFTPALLLLPRRLSVRGAIIDNMQVSVFLSGAAALRYCCRRSMTS